MTTEWGWRAVDGGTVPVRDEAEAHRLADLHKGSVVHRREVGPWVAVEPPAAARWSHNARLAAALRRDAHELDHDQADGVDDEVTRQAASLRARADRIEASGP